MLFSGKSLCDINQPIIVSCENKKTHRANNNNKNSVFQYKIDGDIISTTSPERRCDYLLENETKRTVYLIELKGTDVQHAVEQIEATIKKFGSILGSYTIMPRIIYRGNTHGVNSSRVVKFKRDYPQSIFKETIIEEYI